MSIAISDFKTLLILHDVCLIYASSISRLATSLLVICLFNKSRLNLMFTKIFYIIDVNDGT